MTTPLPVNYQLPPEVEKWADENNLDKVLLGLILKTLQQQNENFVKEILGCEPLKAPYGLFEKRDE